MEAVTAPAACPLRPSCVPGTVIQWLLRWILSLFSQNLQLSGGDKQVTRLCPKGGILCDGRKEKCVREGLLEEVTSKVDLP